jgi:hypothetical protein
VTLYVVEIFASSRVVDSHESSSHLISSAIFADSLERAGLLVGLVISQATKAVIDAEVRLNPGRQRNHFMKYVMTIPVQIRQAVVSGSEIEATLEFGLEATSPQDAARLVSVGLRHVATVLDRELKRLENGDN